MKLKGKYYLRLFFILAGLIGFKSNLLHASEWFDGDFNSENHKAFYNEYMSDPLCREFLENTKKLVNAEGKAWGEIKVSLLKWGKHLDMYFSSRTYGSDMSWTFFSSIVEFFVVKEWVSNPYKKILMPFDSVRWSLPESEGYTQDDLIWWRYIKIMNNLIDTRIAGFQYPSGAPFSDTEFGKGCIKKYLKNMEKNFIAELR